MKKYLNQRFKYYFFIMLGVLIGFIIRGFVSDKPDYTTGIIAVLLGLTVGEFFVL